MGFRRRAATMRKVEVSDAVKEELGFSFYCDIVQKVTRHNIPHSLTKNLDQTPSKFVPDGKATQAKIGSTTVPIASSTEKKVITLTLVIALNGAFLPIQEIYEGKTTRFLPRVKFPEYFCLSFNEKQWGNEKESLKIIEDIIVPYVTKERKKTDQSQPISTTDHGGFQETDDQSCFAEIGITQHPTYQSPRRHDTLFQPLDLTVNGYFKQFMKRKFV